MIQNIECLITLYRSSGDSVKIMLEREGDLFMTLRSKLSADEEELLLRYRGPRRDKARQALETLLEEKLRLGYEPYESFLSDIFAILPPRYAFYRKLEYFSIHHVNIPLFKQLKSWRKKVSSSKNVPPYMIATDEWLRIISAFVPHNEDQMKQLSGFDRQKRVVYSSEILSITKKYAQSHPFPLDWIEREVDSTATLYWMMREERKKRKQKEARLTKERWEKQKLARMLESDVAIPILARRLKCSEATIIQKLEHLALDGSESVINYLRSQIEAIEEKERIVEAIRSVGGQRLKPVYEILRRTNGTYMNLDQATTEQCYNRIRLVRAYLRLKQMID